MLIYSKYSNERSRRFSIRTDIYEENEKRYVEKHAVYPEGKEHVKTIEKWYRELSAIYEEAPFSFNVCQIAGEAVRFEYVEGETLENVLDELISADRIQEAQEKLCQYLDQLQYIKQDKVFEMTDGFLQVFGNRSFEQEMKCTRVTNIDMVCGNLILAETPVMLDYEWTFDFPIPALFVIYRAIHYYVDTTPARRTLNVDKLYEKYNITDSLQKIFKDMERSFQNYITGKHIPIRDLYAEMTPGLESNGVSGKSSLQVYFSMGEGYQEKNSMRFPVNDGEAHLKIEIPAGCKKFRIDPGEVACSVYIERIAVDGKKAHLDQAVVTSGVMNGKWAYIPQNDPGIYDIPIAANAEKLTIDLKIYPGNIELIKRMCDMGQENQHLKNLIQDMRNTKVWKLYQAYRNKVEKKRKV